MVACRNRSAPPWDREYCSRLHAVAVATFAPLLALPQLQGIGDTAAAVQTGSAANFAADLDARIARAATSLAADSPLVVLAEELRIALAPARESLKALSVATERPLRRSDAFCHRNGFWLPDG